MYRQLFAWINWKINVVFDVPGSVGGGKEGEHTFIGILDIFGEHALNGDLVDRYAQEAILLT